MSKRERDVLDPPQRSVDEARRFRSLLESSAADSVFAVSGGDEFNTFMTLPRKGNILGQFNMATGGIELSPEGSTPEVLFHENLHRELWRETQDASEDPRGLPVLHKKIRELIQDLPIGYLEERTRTGTNARVKDQPLRNLAKNEGYENLVGLLADEYMARVATFAYHNVRRYSDPNERLKSAALIEEVMPGAVMIQNWVNSRARARLP